VGALTGAESVAVEVQGTGVGKAGVGLAMVVLEQGRVAVRKEVGRVKEVEMEAGAVGVKVEACRVGPGDRGQGAVESAAKQGDGKVLS
jgi:proline racemase